jgi:hypothetical protein
MSGEVPEKKDIAVNDGNVGNTSTAVPHEKLEVPSEKVPEDNKENDELDAERRKSIVATLAANLEGEIRNPLKDISRAQLLKNVAEFHRSKGLPEDSLVFLRKGAIIAQNPAGFEDEEDLDEDDRQCLRDEVTRRWHHPWPLYYTIFLNSIAAAIQGWDQVSIQAIQSTRNARPVESSHPSRQVPMAPTCPSPRL